MSPLNAARRAPYSYLAAFCASLVALAAALALAQVSPALLSLVWFVAVGVAAWNGGYGPGCVTLVCGLLALGLLPAVQLAPVLLAAFGVKAAIVVFLGGSRRQALDLVTRRASQRAALLELSGMALGQVSVAEFSRRSVQLASGCLGVPYAAVLELEPDATEFTVRAQIGWEGEPGLVWPIGEGSLPACALGQEAAVVVRDLRASPGFAFPEPLCGAARSATAVRIGSGEAPLGVLVFHSGEVGHFGPFDDAFLGPLSHLLAVVIANERVRELRVRSEEMLRASELRYRTFFYQSPEPLWRVELDVPAPLSLPLDEVVEYILDHAFLAESNTAFARLLGGGPVGELGPVPLRQLLPGSDEARRQFVRDFIGGNFRLENTLLVVPVDGGELGFHEVTLVGFVSEGQLVRAWGTRRDITRQKRASDALAASEERFRALFDAAPVPIAIARNDVTLYANAACLAMFGCDELGQFVGHKSVEFVAPEDREAYGERVRLRAAGGGAATSYELMGMRRDGSRFPIRVEVALLHLPEGLASMAFGFDLTQQKLAEAERARLLARERAAAQRAMRLQEVTAALAGALTLAAVAQLVVARGVQALEASTGALYVREQSEAGALVMLDSVGYPEEFLRGFARIGLEASSPSVSAYLHRAPVWLGSCEEVFRDYPGFESLLPAGTQMAVAALPLVVEERVLGVLTVAFDASREFEEPERAFMLTLAGQCAQAMERVRLLQEAGEAALRQKESLALLDALLDSAPVGFALFDGEGRFRLVNEALAHIDGMRSADHIGRYLGEVMPQLDGSLGVMLQEVLRDGVASGEVVMVTPGVAGAGPRHLLTSLYPIYLGEGTLLGAGAVVMDITERVEAESERRVLVEQLERERARFEAILRQMPSAVLIAQAPDGRVVLGNAQVNIVLRRGVQAGRDGGELGEDGYAGGGGLSGVRSNGAPLLPGDWPLVRAMRQGESISGEEIIVARGDGTTGVIRVNAAPIRDREGAITSAVAVFDDVTERARADAAQRFLAEAGSTLITALDTRDAFETVAQLCVPRVADWCIVATHEGDRPRVQAVAGAAPAALVAQLRYQLANDPQWPWDLAGTLSDCKSRLYSPHADEPAVWAACSPAFQQLLAAMEVRAAVLVPLEARGRVAGAMLWLTSSSGRNYDPFDLALAEELGRRAALTADNTRLFREAQSAGEEARKALGAAQGARDEAQSANRAKDEFLAVVSHELRTPLTPIMGWTELLRSGNLDAETRLAAYDAIERNAKAQAQIVNDILDVSRITTGKLRLDLRPVDLAAEIGKALESLTAGIASRNLDFRVNLANVGSVLADAGRLQQVVWNLVQNATKFTPEGGALEVGLVRQGADAVLTVSDTGIGISHEFLPLVFDQFRQADSSATRRAGGLGLGLAIVRHIVESHQGTVEAASAGVGAGAVFTVRLPLHGTVNELAPANPVERWIPGSAEGRPLDGLRVLLVEDEPDNRLLVARWLETAGSVVRTCASGEEALKCLEVWLPQVVVSDIGMPVIDGYQLRPLLRQRLPGVPVLALTAYASAADQRAVAQAGFEAYLTKPVAANKLVSTIASLMEAPVPAPEVV